MYKIEMKVSFPDGNVQSIVIKSESFEMRHADGIFTFAAEPELMISKMLRPEMAAEEEVPSQNSHPRRRIAPPNAVGPEEEIDW